MIKKLKSIESKILFWMIIITAIPLLIVIFQGYHCSKQAIEETKNSQLISILDWKSGNIKNQLNELENQLKLLSIVTFYENSEEDEVATCHKFGCTCNPLTHIQDSKDIYNCFKAYNLQGKEVSNSQAANLSSERLPEDIFDKLSKSDKVLYFKNNQNSMEFTAGSVLINATTKQKTGFVTANINLKQLYFNILKEAPNFGITGKIFILSDKGNEILYNKNTNSLDVKLNKKLLEIINNHKENSSFQVNISGITKLLAFKFIEEIDSNLIISIEKKETLKWVDILIKRTILTGLITFIFVIIIGIMISKKLSAPLKQLANVSSEIINGNLNARVPDMDTKEAYAVSKGFNTMLDKLMQQSKELAKASSLAAIGELSSSIVHEMRNPLSSVKMNVQAIKQRLVGDPTFEELAEIASIQAGRLELMLTELLNFGKPFTLKINKISPITLVKESVDLISTETTKLNQNVVILTDINENFYINGDKEHLTRAITNLIKNASEVSGKKGTINIGINKTDYNLKLIIEDQGKGISDAIKDMIFKPFFTTKEKGTGLGLANVKKIIEYHEGKVYFENKKQGGAIFTIELPLNTKGV